MISELSFNTLIQEHLQLNEVQLQAVTHQGGPLLMLASPGSGKTTTIISRIGYLILEKGVPAKRILAVSFSKASAQDLLRRYESLFPKLEVPQFSTIHSLAYKVMRQYLTKQGRSFQIIEGQPTDESEGNTASITKLKLLSQIYEQLNKERIKEDQLEDLATYISLIKNKRLPKEKWSSVKCNIPQAQHIFERYEALKIQPNNSVFIDFDDMLTLALEAFEQDEAILRYFQQQFSYVMTDESQDTSIVQHKLIEYLVQAHQQLFVVADDDQSIYSWRGADVSYLLAFKEHYPQADILFLQQNYRSTQNIVEAANFIIKQNKSRYPKVMFTENASGASIVTQSFTTSFKEVIYIADAIQKSNELNEIAVLYRNHVSSVLLINELDKRNIPFYMKDADDRFYKHWVIQDIINILRLSYSDKHFNVFEAVAMKLQLYINNEQLSKLRVIHNGESVFTTIEQQLKLEPYQQQQLQLIKDTIPLLKELEPKQAIIQIREKIGYNKVIKQMSDRLGFKHEYLHSILDSLQLIAEDTTNAVQFVEKLKYLEQVQKDAKRVKEQQSVTLSTLHSAKGLEFNTVFMMDVVEGVIPSRQDTEQDELLEEAVRLFYVGMTRARHTLYLLTVEQWFGTKVAQSRYVRQLHRFISDASSSKNSALKAKQAVQQEQQSYPDAITNPQLLIEDTPVEHIQFGCGHIVKHEGHKIHIQFKEHGVKVFLVSIVIERRVLKLTSQTNNE